MKIAVSGKGGVGKTLVAGALATFFAEKGLKVLAIDVDPSPNLALTLGIPQNEAKKIVPISENTRLIESKTKTEYPGVYRLSFSVDDIVKDFSVKSPYNVNLLVMGTVRSVAQDAYALQMLWSEHCFNIFTLNAAKPLSWIWKQELSIWEEELQNT